MLDGVRIGGLGFGVEGDGGEGLEEADEHEGGFVVGELLAETDAGSGYEAHRFRDRGVSGYAGTCRARR